MSETKAKTAAAPATKNDKTKCSVEKCKSAYRAKGYCSIHYKKWRRGEMADHKARYTACSKDNCHKVAGRWGLCEEHAGGKPAEAAAE